MKTRIFIIFMLFLFISAQAKDVTYVKVVAGNPVTDEVVKNFNLVRAVDDEGFVQMIAVFNQTDQYWRSRLIKTDTSGSVLWSRDYLLYGDPGANHRIDGVPFSICRSASNDGYVIAGIFSESRTRVMEHGGYQSSFYLRVDASGNVQNVERHTTYIADSLEMWCFAPLKIKAVGDIGYVVAGVMSDSLSDVTSGTRMGRLCLLDTGLNETKAVVMQSWHAANSNIASATGTFYDALNNVEVVEVPGEGYHYICSGSMTGELLCASSIPQGEFGNALPFIARFDNNLGYMWHRLSLDSSDAPDTHISNTSCGGLYYSDRTGSIFVTIIIVTPDGPNFTHANYIELDATNGNLIKSFEVVISSFGWGGNHFDFYLTQVEEKNDTVVLSGYTNNDHYLPTGIPSDDELSPVVFVVDHANDTAIRGTVFPVDNTNYLTTDHHCYLCYKYQLSDLWEVNGSCTGARQQIKSLAPVIYSPTQSLFNFNKTYFLDALAGPKKDNNTSPSIHRPTLFSIEDQPCGELNDEFVAEYIDFNDYPILFWSSYARRVEMDRLLEVNDLNESECQ